MPQDPPAIAAAPESADALAQAYEALPQATLVAGATDVGLWVTKGLRDIAPVISLHRCADLRGITVAEGQIRVMAATPLTQVMTCMQEHHPSYAALLRRFGSVQVRNAATLGGSIANGSPIGDNAPVLIALGAHLGLRRGAARRSLPVEDFFIAYGQQDLKEGEFIEHITLPARAPNLRCYKISKRFDQDISALCAALNIEVEKGRIAQARLGFGGMAGVPARARHTEAALVGQPWSLDTLQAAIHNIAQDFKPLSDQRASAAYRQTVAGNLLLRYWHDLSGAPTSVLEVRP